MNSSTAVRSVAVAALLSLVTGMTACQAEPRCGQATECGTTRTPEAHAPMPKGPVIEYRSLGPGSPDAVLARTESGSTVRLPDGTVSFRDFTPTADAAFIGIDVPPVVGGLSGPRDGLTTVQIEPYSSTHATDIPTEFPASNRLSLMRITAPTRSIRDVRLAGTAQGHPYNGLLVARVNDAEVTNVQVLGVPGADHQPPGETFGINDYRTSGSVYRRVLVDGEGVGAAGFGANVSRDVTIDDSSFVRNRYSAGATFWEVDDISLTDVRSTDNGLLGLNFERVGGEVSIVRPTLLRNGGGDLRIASDFGSARYTVVDPVLDDGRLRVVLPVSYDGRPNRQRADDIRVIEHGRDVTGRVLQVVAP